MLNKIRRVKIGPRIREDLAKLLELDYKINGRDKGFTIEQALENHLKSIGLIPADYVYDGRLEEVTLCGQMSITDLIA